MTPMEAVRRDVETRTESEYSRQIKSERGQGGLGGGRGPSKGCGRTVRGERDSGWLDRSRNTVCKLPSIIKFLLASNPLSHVCLKVLLFSFRTSDSNKTK